MIMKVIVKNEYSVNIDKTYTETLELDLKEYLEDYFKDKEKITRDDLIDSIEYYVNNLDEYVVAPEDKEEEVIDSFYSAENMDEIVENYKYFINDFECKHENQKDNYCSKCGTKLK